MTQMQRRNWVPDVRAIADELVKDYRDALNDNTLSDLDARGQGDLDAIATMESWLGTAKEHGEEFTEDDWITLVQELARRIGGKQ